MKKTRYLLMVFSAVFAFFSFSNSVSAASIIKYHTQDDIEKAMAKVVATKELSDTRKKSVIEKIMSESSKDELGKLIAEKADKVKKALVNDIDINKANSNITKKINNLSSITIENKDQAEDGKGNPIPEPQGQLWKAYGNRMYTYTLSGTVIPYVLTYKMKVISHYTVGVKGLTIRYVDDSHTAGAGLKITNKYTKWMSKSAPKVGNDISAQAKWEVEVLPGVPVAGHITEFTKFQKRYVKIVKWDKKKKKMYLNQHGKNWQG